MRAPCTSTGSPDAIAEPVQAASEAGLRYVTDDAPGLRRVAATSGKGFAYRDDDGGVVRDEATLQRIAGLAIPPAWTQVWICPHPRGHLQATGRDARGRKQYRYHPQWGRVRGDGKFDHIVAFASVLPKLRRQLRCHLRASGFPRDKVLAIVVSVLSETLIRVGNTAYARSNRSYGLTTLRNRHVAFVRGGRARFQFRGKSGKEQDVVLDDARLVTLLRRCQQLPGQALFQYHDDAGALVPVDSGEVNAYLRECTGQAFTAKDFRTWGGTLAAFQRFARTGLPTREDGAPASEREHLALEKAVIQDVARALGNTPSVCRKAYIDPAVLAGWREGRLLRPGQAPRGERQWETAALAFLKRAHRTKSPPRRRTGPATGA